MRRLSIRSRNTVILSSQPKEKTKMQIDIFPENDGYVVAWSYRDVYVKFETKAEAHEFARAMVSNFTGVTV